jgi:hypothetical protein
MKKILLLMMVTGLFACQKENVEPNQTDTTQMCACELYRSMRMFSTTGGSDMWSPDQYMGIVNKPCIPAVKSWQEGNFRFRYECN